MKLICPDPWKTVWGWGGWGWGWGVGDINANNTEPFGDLWTMHRTLEKVLFGGEVTSTGGLTLYKHDVTCECFIRFIPLCVGHPLGQLAMLPHRVKTLWCEWAGWGSGWGFLCAKPGVVFYFHLKSVLGFKWRRVDPVSIIISPLNTGFLDDSLVALGLDV